MLLPKLDIGRWLTGLGVFRICQPWWHTKRDEVLILGEISIFAKNRLGSLFKASNQIK